MLWKLEEEIDNAGDPSRGDEIPPLEEAMNDDQAPVDPPSLKDGAIRDALFQMA